MKLTCNVKFYLQSVYCFLGVAKMTSEISDRRCEEFGSLNLGGLFSIEWIYQEEIAFQYTQHLCNPWNDNKKVQISRDAQELETNVGKSLVEMWQHNNPSSRDENVEHRDIISPNNLNSSVVEEFYSDEVSSFNCVVFVKICHISLTLRLLNVSLVVLK